MPLTPGTRIANYEIVAPIGKGGMGEVYRARDSRLSREVAIKVLPEAASADQESLRRFEQEARAASALNHPNIVTVYDVGRAGSTSYMAMELVQGKTVREIVAAGPLPLKRALSIAAQAADGLAKAHGASIVHRDLKPENLMVSSDGFVKILDFGLAKLVEPKTENASSALTMAGPRTGSGVVLGTVGYMSPEQASGATLDFRSDQFALGAILYEVVTGRQAFARATLVDTLSAILHEEPAPVASLRPETPTPLRWLIERCLAKEPDERYASTRDLARELAILRDHFGETGPTRAPVIPPRKRNVLPLLAAILTGSALLITGGFLLVGRLGTSPPPSFRQLTFRQGTIRAARFSPDGNTIVYGAAWAGEPLEVFTLRPGTPESRSLGLAGANVLGVSSRGEMAVLLRHHSLGLFNSNGTLARVPLAGGAPREILEDVACADWAPDGASIAVVRVAGSRHRLEFPVGKVLYETTGWISHPRVSPDGLRVAFLDHPLGGDDRGSVMVVDGAGKRATLGGAWATAWGLAWSSSGKEIWFTAAKSGSCRELRAVSLSGKERVVARVTGALTLHDISSDGRVLVAQDVIRFGTLALAPGAAEERELSWLDIGLVTDISPDGKRIVFFESGEGGGEGYSVYVRDTDGSPAVRLGAGRIPVFSPDGKWVLTADIRTDPMQLVLLPTGAGEPVALTGDRIHHDSGTFLPDGKRVLFQGREPGRRSRLYVQALSGGAPVPISPEGGSLGAGPVSPDGRFVAARGPEGSLVLYPIRTGEPLDVPDSTLQLPVQWSSDGRSLYAFRAGERTAKVFRIDPFTGRREIWKEFTPSDPAGVVDVSRVVMTPDARSYAYTYVRILSTLFVAEGLRE